MLSAIPSTAATGYSSAAWRGDDWPVMARKTGTPAIMPTHMAANISRKCCTKYRQEGDICTSRRTAAGIV